MIGTQRLPARLLNSACCGIACLALLLGAAPRAHSAEPAVDWTTTELDVTVTHEQILDAIDRCADFWPQVCRHIEKDGDALADDPARAAAVAVIRQTQFDLHKQFFSSDELAQDAINYTSWGLRRASLFRRVGELLNDREALLRLRATWQNAVTDVRIRPDDLAAEVARRTSETASDLRLDTAKTQQVVEAGRDIAQCMMAMEATETAKLLRQAERLTNNPQARDLLRDIIDAADWAMLIDVGEGRFGVAQFRAAWNELAVMRRHTRVAALK